MPPHCFQKINRDEQISISKTCVVSGVTDTAYFFWILSQLLFNTLVPHGWNLSPSCIFYGALDRDGHTSTVSYSAEKKIAAHKLIGKISYGIMPLVFVTGYLVIRHTYYANLNRYTDNGTAGTPSLNSEEILTKAAASIDIGLIYFIWLVTFYLLAVINRKKVLFHATYMFTAILTILGPTVDRLIYNLTHALTLDYNFLAQNAVLIFIVLLLFSLSIYQKLNGYSVKPIGVALGIYCIGIGMFFSLPHTLIWRSFVELIL